MMLRTYKSLPNDLSRSNSVASNSRRVSVLENVPSENTRLLRTRVASMLKVTDNISDRALAHRLEDCFKNLIVNLKIYKSRYKKLKSRYKVLESKLENSETPESQQFNTSHNGFHSDDELTVPFVPWTFDHKAPLLPIVKSDDNLMNLDNLRSPSEPPARGNTIFDFPRIQIVEAFTQTDLDSESATKEPSGEDSGTYAHFFQSQLMIENISLQSSLTLAKNEIVCIKETLMEKNMQIEALNDHIFGNLSSEKSILLLREQLKDLESERAVLNMEVKRLKLDLEKSEKERLCNDAFETLSQSFYSKAESSSHIEKLNHEIEILKFKLEREAKINSHFLEDVILLKFKEHLNSDSFLNGFFAKISLLIGSLLPKLQEELKPPFIDTERFFEEQFLEIKEIIKGHWEDLKSNKLDQQIVLSKEFKKVFEEAFSVIKNDESNLIIQKWKDSSENWLNRYETTLHNFSLLFAFMYRKWKRFLEDVGPDSKRWFDSDSDPHLVAMDLKSEFKDILQDLNDKISLTNPSVLGIINEQLNGLFLAKQKIQYLERVISQLKNHQSFEENASLFFNDSMKSLDETFKLLASVIDTTKRELKDHVDDVFVNNFDMLDDFMSAKASLEPTNDQVVVKSAKQILGYFQKERPTFAEKSCQTSINASKSSTTSATEEGLRIKVLETFKIDSENYNAELEKAKASLEDQLLSAKSDMKEVKAILVKLNVNFVKSMTLLTPLLEKGFMEPWNSLTTFQKKANGMTMMKHTIDKLLSHLRHLNLNHSSLIDRGFNVIKGEQVIQVDLGQAKSTQTEKVALINSETMTQEEKCNSTLNSSVQCDFQDNNLGWEVLSESFCTIFNRFGLDGEWKSALTAEDHVKANSVISQLYREIVKKEVDFGEQFVVIQKEKEEIQNTLQKLEAEFKVLSDDLIEARMNLAGGNDWNNLMKSLTENRETLKESVAENSRLSNELLLMREKEFEMERELETLKRNLKDSQSRFKSMRSDYSKKDELCKDFQVKLSEAEKALQRVSDAKQLSLEKVNSLSASLRAKDTIVKELKSKVVGMEDLQKRIKDAESAKHELSLFKKSLQVRDQTYQRQRDKMSKTINMLQSELASIPACQECPKLKRENAVSMRRLQQQIQSLEKDLAEYRGFVGAFENALKMVKTQQQHHHHDQSPELPSVLDDKENSNGWLIPDPSIRQEAFSISQKLLGIADFTEFRELVACPNPKAVSGSAKANSFPTPSSKSQLPENVLQMTATQICDFFNE